METYGNGWKRMHQARPGSGLKEPQRSKSIYLVSHMIRSSLSIDFLLRRLIIKCVCYFPEFVSFKALREISFERIWVNLSRFGNPFWHPFREKLGPFWGVKSLQKKTLQPDPPKSLIFNLRAVFGAPGPPQKEPFWKPFRLMLPSRGALRLKIEDFEGVWLQSFFF